MKLKQAFSRRPSPSPSQRIHLPAQGMLCCFHPKVLLSSNIWMLLAALSYLCEILNFGAEEQLTRDRSYVRDETERRDDFIWWSRRDTFVSRNKLQQEEGRETVNSEGRDPTNPTVRWSECIVSSSPPPSCSVDVF